MEVKQGSGIRYAHTNVVAHDWRALADFYIDVFDCVQVGPERDHKGDYAEKLTKIPGAGITGAHLRLPGHGENGPTLEVFQYNENVDRVLTKINQPGFAHMAFQVEEVEAKRDEIIARGGADYGEIQTIEIPGAGTLTLNYMTDPEGNIVELQHWR